MMKNGDKPRSQLCTREELMQWTGWKRFYVDYLVSEKRLRIFKLRPNSRMRYFVNSAQAILDGRK